jgi:glutathione synthase/RimK-type ligase-like ATP-grasp enzyme
MALAAHAELSALYLIGWDIAITARGPVILEANKAPDVEIEQRLDGPWGNGRFGELITYHLTRRLRDASHPQISACAESRAAAL